MRLFIAYHLPTDVLAVILATSFGEAWTQLSADSDEEFEPHDWRLEDYGTIIQAGKQPTYFDLEQILLKGW